MRGKVYYAIGPDIQIKKGIRLFPLIPLYRDTFFEGDRIFILFFEKGYLRSTFLIPPPISRNLQRLF